MLVELFGGLGNQLFQYAAGRIFAQRWNAPLCLCQETDNKHNTSKLDYRKELALQGVHFDFSTKNLPQVPNMRMFYQENGFGAWKPEDYSAPLVLRGYFQYYPVLKDSLPTICNEIRAALSFKRDAMREEYGLTTDSVFIHVRRGDYLKHPDFHYIQGIEYYAQAFRDLIGKRGSYPQNICIVSDDLPWCREQDIFKNMPNRTYVDEDELDTLAIMSLCEGGAILGNSTFSWWGAMLGAEQKKSPVFYPSKWIAKKVENLFPSHWIKIA